MKRLFIFSCVIAISSASLLAPNTALAALWGGQYIYNNAWGHCSDVRLSPDVRINDCVKAAHEYHADRESMIELYDMLANAFKAKSDLQDAIAVYNVTVKIANGTAAYDYQRYLRGDALLRSGSQDAALEEFLSIQRESIGKSPDAYAGLSEIADNKGDFAEALELINKAISINGGNYFLVNRSQLYRDMGDYADASKDDLEIVKEWPNEAWPYNNRCYNAATENRDLESALTDCTHALDILPDEPNALDSLGMVKFRLGKWDEAIATYDVALSHNPYLASSLFMRGISEIKKGDAEKGHTDIEAARALNPRIGAHFATFGIVP